MMPLELIKTADSCLARYICKVLSQTFNFSFESCNNLVKRAPRFSSLLGGHLARSAEVKQPDQSQSENPKLKSACCHPEVADIKGRLFMNPGTWIQAFACLYHVLAATGETVTIFSW